MTATTSVVTEEVRKALEFADDEATSEEDRLAMLVEVAVGLTQRPRSVAWLEDAVRLYDRAYSLAADLGDPLLRARVRLGKAGALAAIPSEGVDTLEAARDELEAALPTLRSEGEADETADAEMRPGLVLQTLVSAHRARMPDAIQAYHRALRFFVRETHPREFAILHNNLATAYLSLPLEDEHAKMREAMAVSSFEEALKVVSYTDEPVEYAMLQNNLGNALQYMPSGHRLANIVRAIEAYDEALRVRTPRDMPVEYANTVSNKANALANLPDDLEAPDAGNPDNRAAAIALYREAQTLFAVHGLQDRAALVGEALAELEAALPRGAPAVDTDEGSARAHAKASLEGEPEF